MAQQALLTQQTLSRAVSSDQQPAMQSGRYRKTLKPLPQTAKMKRLRPLPASPEESRGKDLDLEGFEAPPQCPKLEEPSRGLEGCFQAPHAHVGDGFGFSLSASADCTPGILAVGAPTAGCPLGLEEEEAGEGFGGIDPAKLSLMVSMAPPPGAGGAGAVFVFATAGEECPRMACHLRPPSAHEAGTGRFGHCVSVSSRGEWLAVSAPYANCNGYRRSGSVCVYRNMGTATFVLDQEITSIYSLENDRFGWSCAIDDSNAVNYSAVLVCGCFASTRRDQGRGGGFVQIYQRHQPDEAWHLIQTYDPEGNGLFFGFSVAVSGDFMAVGDPADNFEYKRHQGTLWGFARDTSVQTSSAGTRESDMVESVRCEGCGVSPIVGVRYKCSGCPNFRLGGNGFFMCDGCVDPETKKMKNNTPHPSKQRQYHEPGHIFWNLDEDPKSACHPKFRKDDRTWFNTHGKTGGGMWSRGEPLLKNGSVVAQSDRYQAAGAPGWNDGVGVVFVRECSAVKCRERGLVQAPDTVNVAPAKTAGYRFGSAIDLKWPLLAVGSPGHSDRAGALRQTTLFLLPPLSRLFERLYAPTCSTVRKTSRMCANEHQNVICLNLV